MPSFTDIYASLIENPDIQPPEGQDRDAYVVDLAKQRLRQYKNNEKALSLGMQKTAIETLSDYILTPLRKSMPTTSIGIFADFLQLAIDWDDIMDENAMNSIINSVRPQIANAVLSQYSADDLQTEESRVQLLAEMAHLQIHQNARLTDQYEQNQEDYKKLVADVESENKEIAAWNEGRPSAQHRSPRSAGNPPREPRDMHINIPGDTIKGLVNTKLDNLDIGNVEDLLDSSTEGGKNFRDWGDEASWIKHIGYEAPPLPVPSKDTTPQEEDSQDIADKGWDILNKRVTDRLKYHYGEMYPRKNWDDFDINSPEHNDIMTELSRDDAAAKDIKYILDETGLIDKELSSEFNKFMSEGFGSKFFDIRSELYDEGKDEQDNVRTLVTDHFQDNDLTTDSLKAMNEKDLRKIFKDSGYKNHANLHPDYMKNVIASLFPSNIDDPGFFELNRDAAAEKASAAWTVDDLNKLYAPKALELMRNSYPDITDDELLKIAIAENAHDESPRKGTIGGTNAKGTSVRLRTSDVRIPAFINRHNEALGVDPIQVDRTPSRKERDVYEGLDDSFGWDGASIEDRDAFNTWRANAIDLFLQDAGAFGSSEQGQVLDDLYERVSKETGLPQSLVALGSDEAEDNHMTEEMRKAIHNSLRSNIILHAVQKEIPNREVPSGKEPDDLQKPLEVTAEDLNPHYQNAISESMGYSDGFQSTIKRLQEAIANNDYPETSGQGVGRSRVGDQAHLARLLGRLPKEQGQNIRKDLREEASQYNYEIPDEDRLDNEASSEDALDKLFNAILTDQEDSSEETSEDQDGVDEVGADVSTDEEVESTDSEEVEEEVVNESGDEESADSEDDEQTSEASGMDSIKNIINESDTITDSVKDRVKEAKNIREINNAVSNVTAPISIKAIPSLPLTPSALTEAMRLGLFDLEGNPTPRGDHFLNMVGEAMPDIQEMMNTDDFKDAYKEKYTKTRFNPVRALSKVAFNNIILGWNGIHDEDNQIAWDESNWDQETTQVTKMNGDPVDDDFYSKEFTFGDDAPHLKKAMWGDEEAEHNIFSRMIMSGIIAGRLGNAGQDEWDELMKEGSLFKGRITQVNGDDVSGQDPINNDDLNTDDVKDEMEAMYEAMGGIQSGEEGENFIGDFGVIQDPAPPSDEGEQGRLFDEWVANVGTATDGNPAEMSNELTLEDGTTIKFGDPIGDSAARGGGTTRQLYPVELPDGTRKVFYQRSGTGDRIGDGGRAAKKDDFSVMNGIDVTGWYIKEGFEDDTPEHLRGLGTELNLQIATAFNNLRDEGKLPTKQDMKPHSKLEINDYVDTELARSNNENVRNNPEHHWHDETDRLNEERAKNDFSYQADSGAAEAISQEEAEQLQFDFDQGGDNGDDGSSDNIVDGPDEMSKKEKQINRMMKEQFGDDWKKNQANDDAIDSYHEHLSDMDDAKFSAAYDKYHDREMNKRSQGTDKPSTDTENIDREKYYAAIADHEGITEEEAKNKYSDSTIYDESAFRKVVTDMHSKPQDNIDRQALIEKLAKLRGVEPSQIESDFDHADDKHLQGVVNGELNRQHNDKVTNENAERQQREKITAREANHTLTHQFRTPDEFKLQADANREGAGEEGAMSMDEAADMFRAVAHHAFPNKHLLDEKGTERLSELFSGLVQHLQSQPEGLEHLDKIYAEVEMARDHGITYGSQEWFDHIDSLSSKERGEAERKELEEIEDKRKGDEFETAIERAFNHPHSGDHSNRAHSFDLTIETDEDGKHSVKNVEHKGGVHHDVDDDGNAVESEHDHTSHRGEGRSEHAPYDPDHTPEQQELYNRIHAHRQRMDDLESPIRDVERKHSSEKSNLEAKRDAAFKKRDETHGRRRTGIQAKKDRLLAELTEVYDGDMESLSSDMDDVSSSHQDQMADLKAQKKAEHSELRRGHGRNAATTKERMDASGTAIEDQHETHKKELADLDTQHEQERSDFDAGTGQWDLEELQRTNPEAAARYADPEQREAVKQEFYDSHSVARRDKENEHADQIDQMEAFHAENTKGHDDLQNKHLEEQKDFERTSREDVQELQRDITRATKDIQSKINKRTDEFKESEANLEAEIGEDTKKLDDYIEGVEAEYDAEHKASKDALQTKHDQEHQEASSDLSEEYSDGAKVGKALEKEYLDSAEGDEKAYERMNRNLDHSDLGATENSHARHAEEESERIQGEAQEAAQGMMDEDTPAPGTPSPNNPNLVYKPGPGKNWVTRDTYNAAVAHGLLAGQNNSVAFTNQGGQIVAHHGTDSWHVSPHDHEDEAGRQGGARSSQEVIGHGIHQGVKDWTDEEGVSFQDKAHGLKEGETFSIPHDQFTGGVNSSLITGMTGRAKETTDPSSTDDKPQSAASKFLGGMGRKVFQPALQAIKEEGAKAGQGLAEDLRSGRWQKQNMMASGEGSDKRYKKGWGSSYNPDKDHVGQASLSRELKRFNPFKGQQSRAELSTENQVENQSRQVQALQGHIQGQNKALAQMGGQTPPTVKPVASPSVTALQNHVKNKVNPPQTDTTAPPPS